MAIDYRLYIDWVGTDDGWFADAEACWIPRGAVTPADALVDLTGNGNDLTYDEYAESGWAAATGWAGVDGEYFDTGIVPQLEQTIYVAVTGADTLGNFATAIGTRESISGTFRQHAIQMQGESDAVSTYRFENTSYNDTRRTDAVIAINKAGFWVNGTEVSAQAITDDYTFTINMFLMAQNNAGSAANYLIDGHVAAVCIVNATDSDDTIAMRSFAMRNIINTNYAWLLSHQFEDDLVWWNTKRGIDYYISPTGRGFEPQAIGRATFILDNASGDYDPYNTASPLYGFISSGKLLKFGAQAPGLGGQIPIFSGVIDDIKVDRRNKKVTLLCVDMMGWLNQKRPSVAIQQNITADVAIRAILDAVNYPSIFRQGISDGLISKGIDTIPYWWTTGKTAKQEIEDVVAAGLGFFNTRGSGRPFYYTRRTSLVKRTWTESLFEKNITPTEPWENVRNIIEMRVTTRKQMDAAVIWEYDEAKRLAPGEEVEIWGSFRHEGEFVPALDVQEPVAVFNARESGLGDDLLGDLTITTTIYSTKIFMRVKNDGLEIGHIISMTVSGKPVVSTGTSTIIQNARGYEVTPKPFYFENNWLQDYNTAQGFGQFLIQYLNNGQPIVTIARKINFTTAFDNTGIFEPFNELYYPVTLDFDTMNIDGDYRIMSIEYNCGINAQDVSATYKIMPAYNKAGTQFFTLDTSLLDGVDLLAW